MLRPGRRPTVEFHLAFLAKEAFKVGKTVRDLCLEKMKAGTLKKKDSDVIVTEAELTKALDPRSMTEPAA